ncbi:tetratricopeptide (TPR) repeat protein [Paucibacter oligotrophus]|uniref:Tetratricopeptide (TPR) repeat protein n=1 Tax=Roseateles oligotrophus TaxID=1769250 RepID=A0A840L8R5_9BURK|nr:hypothetical protein [Roseateles oligotrophus]MBB4844151.1 tetratricopeptide (TPR) repeat protein [Roseateles oligotrophus]
MKNIRTLPSALALLLGLCAALPAFAQLSLSICGPLKGSHYGPYDYRPDHQKQSSDPMSHAEKRELVEHAHFTPRVENLIGAQSGGMIGSPGPDLSYTLRAFPNNHRALVSVIRYGEKFKTETPPGLQYPVECYFERAIRFAPDDVIVRIIYSTYLTKKSRSADAIKQLQISSDLAGDQPFTHFNIGLAYFDLKEFAAALQSAHRAQALGFERPDLQEKLRGVGQWQEPAPVEAAASAASSASAASAPSQDKP